MPVCSVLGCGIRKTLNQPSLSFHRLPRNEFKKKKWLEAIGLENIRPNVKDVYICSLHFDEKCFNKTLDVTRLRDDAVPLKFVRQHTSQHKPATLKENQLETIPVLAGHNVPNLVPLEIFNTSSYTALAAVTGASEIASFIPSKKTATTVITPAPGTLDVGIPVATQLSSKATLYTAPLFASVPGTSGVHNVSAQNQKIKKLEDTCDYLRKKVKKLNEKVRRQKKKIAEFQNIIKDLQERNLVNNENSLVLEACAGPKDFLKRQILKSEGLPMEKQYSKSAGLHAEQGAKRIALHHTATAEEVTQYVRQKTDFTLKVFQLRSRRYVHFISFVVRVPQPLQETIACADFWAKGVFFGSGAIC